MDSSWLADEERQAAHRPPIGSVHQIDKACIGIGKLCIFDLGGVKPFQNFTNAKRALDELSGVTGWRLHDLRRTCVSGMARLGVPPHVADKILNHQSGTISGVAAVYQRHHFLAERKLALERWGQYIE